jgi:hypothetical protein
MDLRGTSEDGLWSRLVDRALEAQIARAPPLPPSRILPMVRAQAALIGEAAARRLAAPPTAAHAAI